MKKTFLPEVDVLITHYLFSDTQLYTIVHDVLFVFTMFSLCWL